MFRITIYQGGEISGRISHAETLVEAERLMINRVAGFANTDVWPRISALVVDEKSGQTITGFRMYYH